MNKELGIALLGWFVGLVGLIPMALVVQTLFPRVLRRASDQLERGRWSSLIVGALAVLIAYLAAHVAGQGRAGGKFIGGLVLFALVFAGVLGLAACFRSLGSRMYFGMNSLRADMAFPSTLLGGLVLWLSALVPMLGWLVLAVANTMGLGAFLIAFFSKREKTVAAPAPARPTADVPPKIIT
jgi:predicted lysophospholipase L1 biosynthesis ABC-type transport system permease subunit